jgi:hypothetical protein
MLPKPNGESYVVDLRCTASGGALKYRRRQCLLPTLSRSGPSFRHFPCGQLAENGRDAVMRLAAVLGEDGILPSFPHVLFAHVIEQKKHCSQNKDVGRNMVCSAPEFLSLPQ